MGNFLTCGHFGYTPHLINKQGSEEGGHTCTYMYMYSRKIRRGRERGEQDMHGGKQRGRQRGKEGERKKEINRDPFYIYMYLYVHTYTLREPSSNPTVAKEPSWERAQERAHGESGVTSERRRTSPVSVDHT